MSTAQDLSTFHKRLLWARQQARLTQEQVAGLGDMSQANYSKLERSGMGSTHVAKLSKVLGVSAQWLADGEGEIIDSSLTSAFSPIEFTHAADGHVDDGAPLMIKESWLQLRGYKHNHLFAIKATGSSMEPSIFSGDSVVINTANIEPSDGGVFLVNYEGAAVIRRLTRDAGAWWLDCDNPNKTHYPRKILSTTTAVVGRVIYKQSEFI